MAKIPRNLSKCKCIPAYLYYFDLNNLRSCADKKFIEIIIGIAEKNRNPRNDRRYVERLHSYHTRHPFCYTDQRAYKSYILELVYRVYVMQELAEESFYLKERIIKRATLINLREPLSRDRFVVTKEIIQFNNDRSIRRCTPEMVIYKEYKQ